MAPPAANAAPPGTGRASSRDWLTQTVPAERAHGLLAPWVLHTGLGPDAAGSGFMTLVHKAFIGGDSSTLQTRTVEALITNSWSEYGFLATWLCIGVLTPIVEEAVFRGMLLGGMARHISVGWANLVQALLFATVHGAAPRFLVYFAMALAAGWMTRRYRSLLPAIALHALNNTVALLIHG